MKTWLSSTCKRATRKRLSQVSTYLRSGQDIALEPRLLLAADPVITELLASNSQTLDDGNGRSSDWIEIFNAGDETANLNGWYLTDDQENLDRWQFPEFEIEPQQFAIVFASGINSADYVDQAGYLHANFKLSSSGETLALVRPDLTVADQLDFPAQFSDISYGRTQPGLDQVGFFSPPTPNEQNGVAISGVTEGVVAISKESGVFTESFSVDLSTSTPEATIVFTLDGSLPTADSTTYVTPIEVSSSTQIRARVLETDRILGPTSTASFSKLSPDVVDFSSRLPVMVIDNYGAGDIPNTGWNQTNAGIQQLPRQAANLMLFEADEAGARLDANADLSSRIGIRVRGAFSSSFKEPGLSVETWSDGADVDQAISPTGIAADSDWVLYAPNPTADETLIDNSFLFEISNQMGQWAPEIQYFETFVNTDGGDITMDDHVGLYVITEKVKRTPDRIDFEEFAVDGTSGGWLLDINRLDSVALDGTLPKNFHTAGPDGIVQTDRDLSNSSSRGDDIPRQSNAYINYDDPSGLSINPVQRDAIAGWFDEMESVLFGRTDGVEWNDPINGYPKYIDVDNFIDYFILNDISHNGDGLLLSLWVYNPDPNGDGKLKFGPIWDADLGSFSGAAANELMRRTDRLWYGRMFEDPNFVQKYTERWQELRRTVLSDDNMGQVIDRFYEQIGDEAAVRDNVDNWRTRLDRMQTWVADRATAIDQLFVDAPQLNQDGGTVADGFELKILSDRGDVFYTLDGTDPRAADGSVNPQAFTVQTESINIVPTSAPASIIVPDVALFEQIGTSWMTNDFVEGAAGETWTQGATGVGFDSRGTYDDLIETNLGVITDLSVYVRIPFEVSGEQLDSIEQLALHMQYDDGFVAHLNGIEIVRMNTPGNAGEPVPVDERAVRSHRARFDEFDVFSLDGMSLHEGTNYLTVQGINRTTTGGDLLIRPQIWGVTFVSPPIILREPTNVFARSKDGDEWSGPTTAQFTIGDGGILGDLNGDGRIAADDVDRLCTAIHNQEMAFDLNADGVVDTSDLQFYVRQQLSTSFGDANVDGIFDSSDLVAVFQAGQYEDGAENNSTWATGDWNCDGEFGSADLVVAFQQGGFVAAGKDKA